MRVRFESIHVGFLRLKPCHEIRREEGDEIHSAFHAGGNNDTLPAGGLPLECFQRIEDGELSESLGGGLRIQKVLKIQK